MTAESAPTPPLSWPRRFTLEPIAGRMAIMEDLTMQPSPSVFVQKGDSIVLGAESSAGQHLSAMAECGEQGCSCSRLHWPLVRPAFRKLIVHHAPAERPLKYLGLASGLLLSDAEILSGLSQAGATIGSIMLVDAEYGKYRSQRDVAALAQLSRLFAPTPVTAFNTLPSFIEACTLQPERFKSDVLVASDPSTHVAQLFKRFASEALAEGGYAFLLLNGGKHGTSTRVWRRVPPRAMPSAADRDDALAVSDASLGLEEVKIPPTPSERSEGELFMRRVFDRDALAWEAEVTAQMGNAAPPTSPVNSSRPAETLPNVES
jgi:hypothetical protein